MRDGGQKKRGWVKFPVKGKRYVDTREGGMFVRLVVAPKDSENYDWMRCVGGFQNFFEDEVLLGDDVHDKVRVGEQDIWPLGEDNPARRFHFPNSHRNREELLYGKNKPKSEMTFAERCLVDYRRMISTDYLAVLTIGSTSWSGYSKEDGYWRCSFWDLTLLGKLLYLLMRVLYGKNNQIYLQTWLDT